MLFFIFRMYYLYLKRVGLFFETALLLLLYCTIKLLASCEYSRVIELFNRGEPHKRFNLTDGL